MQFENIRLNGFKAFVDPVELPIKDGLSGIVGPNGCGKSNLVEALGWVMGENRPSAMRSDAMDDVIFAGAATRPARPFAEVALEIDNSGRKAPAAFNRHDKIEIARRISRDGGSSYRANGVDVRRRDVQMLFADSATGSRSSALVRQGQIADLINAKPAARSGILEDAAGISGLFQRRHEAELKLNATEANLQRVQDIAEQHQERIAALAKQARQAARYRKLAAQLRDAEAVYLCLRWLAAETACAEVREELERLDLAASQLEARSIKRSRKREEIEASLPPLRLEAGQADARLQRLKTERDAIRNEEDRAKRLLEAADARIRQLEMDTEREAGLQQDASGMIGKLNDQERELSRANEGRDEALVALEAEVEAAEAELNRREEDLSKSQEQAALLLSRQQAAERSLEDARAAVAKLEKRELSIAESLHSEEARLAEAAGQVKSVSAVRAKAEKDAEAAGERFAAAEAARFAAQERLAEARAANSEAESRLAALRSEAAELERLLASEVADGGSVLDRVSVEPGYEKALGAALGDDLFAHEIEQADETGWSSLPPYDKQAALPGGAEPLSNHVDAPPFLARRLAHVGLVDEALLDRLQPELRPGQRIVSEAGDLRRWDGYKLAARDGSGTAALRLRQKNRRNELVSEEAEAARAADAAKARLDQVAEEFDEASREDHEARSSRRHADAAFADAERKLSQAVANSSVAERTLDAFNSSREQARTELEAAKAALDEAASARAAIEDPEVARRGAAEARSEVDAARALLMNKRAASDARKRENEERARRLTLVYSELRGWRKRLESAGTRISELAERRDALAEERRRAAEMPSQLESKREVLRGRIEEAETLRRKASDALAAAEGEFQKAKAEETESAGEFADAREARARADARLESASAQAGEAGQRLTEQHGPDPRATAAKYGVEASNQDLVQEKETEVARLRRSLELLGAVNLRAEQDIEEIQAVLDELVGERDDLEAAVRKLRSTIATLNREGSDRLADAFNKVNENFSRLFKHLFGGGNARLELSRSDDPLEAGLEILCHPPGKRFSTLSLLSGGEQTLTAIALIFAFFLVNPAPICVLDEVDAPLDDANVGRFCDLLREIGGTTKTRFLVITHHSITMSRMDRLFGITMQEQGVSQLVSVDLGEAQRMAA